MVARAVAVMTARGSPPEKRKANAEARHIEEQTKTMQEHKSCLKKAGKNEVKLDACERLLKANE